MKLDRPSSGKFGVHCFREKLIASFSNLGLSICTRQRIILHCNAYCCLQGFLAGDVQGTPHLAVLVALVVEMGSSSFEKSDHQFFDKKLKFTSFSKS